jgi:polyketide biosynthesis acyl carrier protein
MNKTEILNVITKHLVQSVDGLSADTIDPSKALTEYGANSLDIVEIVSASMRELKIKIPRSELADIENIDALVEMFAKHAPQ